MQFRKRGMRETLLKSELTQNLSRKINALLSEVIQWEQLHVIKSPIDGRLVIDEYLNLQDYVSIGDSILLIIPLSNNSLIGKMRFLIEDSGKSLAGQNIQITFQKYPQNQYGSVAGLITEVIGEPDNHFCMAEVSFPDGLRSSSGIDLEYIENMVGETNIVTDELSLLERAFYKSTSFLRNN
jgi:hypothetical protein